MKLGKNLFLYAKSAGHLLAMMGLHSVEDFSWRHNLLEALEKGFVSPDTGLNTPDILVHRHRRTIHPTKLQEIENIREFPAFVNAPKESVH